MNIEWREINPDYIVSSDGQVGSRKRGGLKMLKPRPKNGYSVVHLCIGGRCIESPIHKLVANSFLPSKPTPRHQVNHKNGIKSDNRDANLEWVTPSQNRRHGIDVLRNKSARGAGLPQTKLTEAQAREIRARCASGELQKRVALVYGICAGAVSHIVRGKNWAWLDAEAAI